MSTNGRTLYLLDFYRGTLQRATLPVWLGEGAANAKALAENGARLQLTKHVELRDALG